MFASNLGPSTFTRHKSARHSIDPALNSILESTLTPDDNDLFLSNLVGVSILVVHGQVCSLVVRSFPDHLLEGTMKTFRRGTLEACSAH